MSNGVNPLTANVVLIRADFLQPNMMSIKYNQIEKKVRMIAFGEKYIKWNMKQKGKMKFD